MKLLGISLTLSLSFLIADLVDYNLELLSVIEFDNDNNNYGVSDVWGYTDEYGNEYAIVGYKDGTAIYDVSSILSTSNTTSITFNKPSLF